MIYFCDLCCNFANKSYIIECLAYEPVCFYVCDVDMSTGHIVEVDAMACAQVCGQIGGSRFQASDTIDPAVGIVIKRHVGCHVSKGEW